MENYYKVLGLARTANDEDIKKAYLRMIKIYHPDVYEGDKHIAEEMTANINYAYDFLTDKDKKRQLDDFLLQQEKLQKQHKESKIEQQKNKPKSKSLFKKKTVINDNKIKQKVKDKIVKNKLTDDNKMKLNLAIFAMFIALILLVTILIIII